MFDAVPFKSFYWQAGIWSLLFVLTVSFIYPFFGLEFALGKTFLAFAWGILLCYFNYWSVTPLFFDKHQALAYLLISSAIVLTVGTLRFYSEDLLLAKFSTVPKQLTDNAAYLRYIFSTSSFFMLGFVARMGQSWMEHRNKMLQSEALMRKTELKMLKNQLRPHFLFNTINNIYSIALEKDDKVAGLLLEISDMLRYLIYEAEKERVLLHDEIRFLNTVIRLFGLSQENLPFGKIELPKATKKPYTLAPLLLLPFIENIFKHGDFSGNIYLWKLDLNIDNGILTFITKNPIREHDGTNEKPSGIGLNNVKKRLAILYPHKHTLKTTQNSGTFEVLLKLTLDEK